MERTIITFEGKFVNVTKGAGALTKSLDLFRIMGSLISQGGVKLDTKEQKNHVLRLFLQFIQKYMPLNEAVIASLGGEGREAKIWQESGISADNGWVIERQKSHSDKLIRESPYHYVSSLRKFPKAFRAISGSKRQIDAFHLDLCGTIEPAVEKARRIVLHVAKGRGRCLAVTVADARRNLSVENFPAIEKKLQRMLGFRYERLKSSLASEHSASNGLGVIRELGFFYHMILLLKFYGRYALPDKVYRYGYVSYSSGAPFPMRTYFFHFSKKSVRGTDASFAKQLYTLWLKQELLSPSQPLPEKQRKQEKPEMSKYPKLESIVKAVGGDAEAEFKQLTSAASRSDETAKFQQFMQQLSELVTKFSSAGIVSAEPNGGKPQKELQPVRPSRPTKPNGCKRIPHGAIDKLLPNGDKLNAQLNLIYAAAEGAKALKEAKIGLIRKLKLSRKKKGGNMIGGLLARTQGKHRKNFLVRLQGHDPSLINEQLAAAYSAMSGQAVTVDELRAEAVE
ncbi:MAG: hypothetical protein KW788_01410 [Candidatus Doudnabacteria bacterium]|nr:hypothetical protein [Candidatus Doudnabacteria bacterium]